MKVEANVWWEAEQRAALLEAGDAGVVVVVAEISSERWFSHTRRRLEAEKVALNGRADLDVRLVRGGG